MSANNRNPSTITYNPTTSKYSVTYDGKTIETTLTDKSAVTDEWVQEILSLYADKPMVVGLDIEWKPHPIRSMSNKSATLQLCIDDKCLILQLFYMDDIPQSLKTFLGNSNFTFVGIEVADDIAKLKDEYGLECSSSADIKALAKSRWPGRFRLPGLKDLAWEVVGLFMEKPKHVCMSNWDARVLNDSQIEYACIDAYASYKIGHKLIIESNQDLIARGANQGLPIHSYEPDDLIHEFDSQDFCEDDDSWNLFSNDYGLWDDDMWN